MVRFDDRNVGMQENRVTHKAHRKRKLTVEQFSDHIHAKMVIAKKDTVVSKLREANICEEGVQNFLEAWTLECVLRPHQKVEWSFRRPDKGRTCHSIPEVLQWFRSRFGDRGTAQEASPPSENYGAPGAAPANGDAAANAGSERRGPSENLPPEQPAHNGWVNNPGGWQYFGDGAAGGGGDEDPDHGDGFYNPGDEEAYMDEGNVSLPETEANKLGASCLLACLRLGYTKMEALSVGVAVESWARGRVPSAEQAAAAQMEALAAGPAALDLYDPEAALVEDPPEAAALEEAPPPAAALVEDPPDAAMVEDLSQAEVVEDSSEATVQEPAEAALVGKLPEDDLPEAAVVQDPLEAAIVQDPSEAALVDDLPEAAVLQNPPEAAVAQDSPEAAAVQDSLGAGPSHKAGPSQEAGHSDEAALTQPASARGPRRRSQTAEQAGPSDAADATVALTPVAATPVEPALEALTSSGTAAKTRAQKRKASDSPQAAADEARAQNGKAPDSAETALGKTRAQKRKASDSPDAAPAETRAAQKGKAARKSSEAAAEEARKGKGKARKSQEAAPERTRAQKRKASDSPEAAAEDGRARKGKAAETPEEVRARKGKAAMSPEEEEEEAEAFDVRKHLVRGLTVLLRTADDPSVGWNKPWSIAHVNRLDKARGLMSVMWLKPAAMRNWWAQRWQPWIMQLPPKKGRPGGTGVWTTQNVDIDSVQWGTHLNPDGTFQDKDIPTLRKEAKRLEACAKDT